jgi:hypothetical protein
MRTSTFGCIALAALALLAGGGCASSNVKAQWTDPQFANHPLQGATVLVRCDARETVLRQVCLEQMSQQLRAAGALPVTAQDASSDAPLAGDGREAARATNARAVLTSRIAPGASVAAPRPTIGFGVGSWGGNVSTGVGVNVPVGEQRVNTSYMADMVLTDVESGKVMWTSSVATPASSNVNAQVADLAKSGVEAAKKSGLF